jgi:tetratricopeptide (TPR) repeat protein
MIDNSNRVQKGRVEKKSNRWTDSWIVKVAIGLAIAAFIGLSLLPFFSSFNQQGNNSSTPTSTATVADAQKSELQQLEKGYQLVLQREPDNQTALQGLLETRLKLIQLGLGDVKSVIEPLEKLAKLNPERTDYRVLLAQAQQQAGKPTEAEQIYRSILATKPGDTNTLQGLVALLIQEQRSAAAIGLLQDTLATAPQANKLQPGSVDVPSVQLLLGQVYADQKRYDEAIALYEQVSETNKNDFRPVLAKALILKEQSKVAEAQPLFKSAAALAPAEYKDQIKQLANQTAPPSTSAPAGQPQPPK